MKVVGKYNFLLIHDDGVTKSFRISRRTLRLLVLIAVLLPVVGGGGVWIGWHAWKDRQVWEQEERVLQQELANLRVQLDRLSNVERLVQLYDAGQLREPDVPVQPGPGANARAGSVSEAPLPSPAQDGAGQTPPPAAGTGAPAAVPAADAATAEDAPDKLAVDTGQVRIDNVSARLSKDRKLRIRMDLYNESGRQISGTLAFFLLTADEQRTPLPQGDAAFKISRLKKFASTTPVPESVADLTNAALMVEVNNTEAAGKPLIFRQIYSIAE